MTLPSVPGYTVERAIGAGGMGTILLARRDVDGITVALKIAHATDSLGQKKSENEAYAMSAIGPPAVPRVYESGPGYLVLEFFSAPTLETRIKSLAAPMPLEEFGASALAICDALAQVHALHFIHLDLKPANIFIIDGCARLIDFGEVKSESGDPRVQITDDGMVVGTMEYIAPEQTALSRRIVDRRTDLYSLGAVFYEMLTGRPPFTGNAGDIVQAHQNRRPRRPSELVAVPPEVEAVVLRCLQKTPERRFSDVAALKAALLTALAVVPSPTSVSETTGVREKAAAPRTPTSQKRPLGVIFFQTASNANVVRDLVASYAGVLAHVAKDRYGAVFDFDVSENPLVRAVAAAHALSRQLSARALVDLAPIAVQIRPDGPKRFFSAAFGKSESYPDEALPVAAFITGRAAETLSELECTPVADRPFFLLRGDADRHDRTRIRTSRQVLVGRDTQVRTLLDVFERTKAEKLPSVALLLADSGYGKTAIAGRTLEHLRSLSPPPDIIDLRAVESIGGNVDETLSVLLQRVFAFPEAPPKDGVRAILAAHIGEELALETWPAVALALRVIDGDAPELKRYSAAPGALRASLIRAIGEGLRRLAARGPLCLLLDDAQFADDTTLGALDYATLAEARVPLFVCAFARPIFIQHRAEFGAGAAIRETIALGTLDDSGAQELCRHLLAPAENIPTVALAKVVERTKGVPLLLVELCRGLKRDGLVRKDAHGGWYFAADELEGFPDLPLVEWLAERELSMLSPELVAQAKLAALLGAQFPLSDAEGVVDELEKDGLGSEFPLDPQAGFAHLVASGLLVDSGGRIQFRHSLLREVAARLIPAAMKTQLHRAALRFYLHGEAAYEKRLPHLAHHAAAAGQDTEASQFFWQLAERARLRHAYLEAENYYTRVLSFFTEAATTTADAPLKEQLMSTLRGRGLMRYRIGRYQEALADLTSSGSHARDLGRTVDQVEILLDQATALDWMNEFRKSFETVREAQQLSVAAAPLMRGRLALAIGRSCFRFGKWDKAILALSQASELSVGDDGYESLIISLLMLGYALPFIGKTLRAERVFDRIVKLCTERGDRLHLAAALNNRLNIRIARKDVDGLESDLLMYMQIGRELGLVPIQYFGEYNLGETLFLAGRIEQAWRHVDRAVTLERNHFDLAGRPLAALLKARLHAFAGDRDGMRSTLDEIAATQARELAAGKKEAAFVPSEQVLYNLVDLMSRDSSALEWQALRELSAKDSILQEPIEVIFGEALFAARGGDTLRARALGAEALRVAKTIPNVMEEHISSALALDQPPSDNA